MAMDINNSFNKGDADFGIMICPDIDNRDELRNSICKTVSETLLKLKIKYFSNGSILSDLIETLVTQSIKDAGFSLAVRPDIKIEKLGGLTGLLFNGISEKHNYNGYLYTSENNTLNFVQNKNTPAKCSAAFQLQRLCISFTKDGKFNKSEVLDIAIPEFSDVSMLDGSFYKYLDGSKCIDFSSNEFIDHISRILPNCLPTEMAELLKLAKTL